LRRGSWRIVEDRLLIFYDDGATDKLHASDGFFSLQSFLPGATGAPVSEYPAVPVEKARAKYVGVWRMEKEPDGSIPLITLESSGRAISSVPGVGDGKWTVTKEGALCTWNDGWSDLIFESPTGYQKRTWVGSLEQQTLPPDTSAATRIGQPASTSQ